VTDRKRCCLDNLLAGQISDLTNERQTIKEVFAGELAGACELSFDEIDLVSGGGSVTVTATNSGWGNTAVQTGAGAVIGAVAGGIPEGQWVRSLAASRVPPVALSVALHSRSSTTNSNGRGGPHLLDNPGILRIVQILYALHQSWSRYVADSKKKFFQVRHGSDFVRGALECV